MRIWRTLKSLGGSALRDGVYLLPETAPHHEALQKLAAETIREGGTAWLLATNAQSKAEEASFQALFDRKDDYGEFLKSLATLRKLIPSMPIPELAKMLRRARREFEALRATDFFPDEISSQAQAVWLNFVHAVDLRLSPGEPRAIDSGITRMNTRKYRGRVWATRQHLWVDRVASAWLIRRFIDPAAQFMWLAAAGDCPASAIGFDFDGAAFTHVGRMVTFEVLAASFGLEHDPGLARLAAIVHCLDSGDGFVPEACGFEAIMSGARHRAGDDDSRLLAEISLVLDSLYTHFANAVIDAATGDET